jgi:hypothetical protein
VKEMAIIKLRRTLADILVNIAPDVYNAYATTDKKGMKQLVILMGKGLRRRSGSLSSVVERVCLHARVPLVRFTR